MNIKSATGLKPVAAAPAAIPIIADSVIGVSMTLSEPNSVHKPLVTPSTPPKPSSLLSSVFLPPCPPRTSSPTTMTLGSRRISNSIASLIAFR